MDRSDPGCTSQVLVVSDTHLTAGTLDRMPPEVWEMADAAEVVIHAGDAVEQALLDALAVRAPLHAVLGNNDAGLVGLLPEVLELDLAGVRVAILHDAGPRKGRGARMARRFPDAAVVVFGHSHEPVVEQVEDGPLLVNPGSPTHRRRQPVHTVARLELGGGEVRAAEIVEVGPHARPADRHPGRTW
jgi:uncharacterized protein